MAAHLDQAQKGFVDPVHGVLAGAAHMRGRHQTPLGRIAPAVIGTANGPFDLARAVHEDHAPVAANVVKHTDAAGSVADQQKGDAKEGQRDGIARLGHIRGNRQPGPACDQQCLAFFLEHALVNVVGVGQPMCR